MFKQVVSNIKTNKGRKTANKMIRGALQKAGLKNITNAQLTAIRQQLLGEDLEPSVETLLTETLKHLDENMTITEEYYTDYTNPAETQAMEDFEKTMNQNITDLLVFSNNMGCELDDTDHDSYWSSNDEYTFHIFIEATEDDYDSDQFSDVEDMLNAKLEELFSTLTLPKELKEVYTNVNFPDVDLWDEDEDEFARGLVEIIVTFPRNLF